MKRLFLIILLASPLFLSGCDYYDPYYHHGHYGHHGYHHGYHCY